MAPRIRPVALAVVLAGDRLLVIDAEEPGTGRRFHRLFGGGIEFGERAEDAVVREIREELGAELLDVERLGVVENLFVYEGRAAHEVVFLFLGRVADRAFYERERIDAVEANGRAMTGIWRRIGDPTAPPLYPDGVEELLTGR